MELVTGVGGKLVWCFILLVVCALYDNGDTDYRYGMGDGVQCGEVLWDVTVGIWSVFGLWSCVVLSVVLWSTSSIHFHVFKGETWGGPSR